MKEVIYNRFFPCFILVILGVAPVFAQEKDEPNYNYIDVAFFFEGSRDFLVFFSQSNQQSFEIVKRNWGKPSDTLIISKDSVQFKTLKRIRNVGLRNQGLSRKSMNKFDLLRYRTADSIPTEESYSLTVFDSWSRWPYYHENVNANPLRRTSHCFGVRLENKIEKFREELFDFLESSGFIPLAPK